MFMHTLVRGDGHELPFAVLVEGGIVFARVATEADARQVVAALNLVEAAATRFPGLIDGEQPVSGADLVDLFGERLAFGDDGRSYREPDS